MKDLSYVKRQSSPRESLSVVCLLSPELQEVASSKVLKELIAKVKALSRTAVKRPPLSGLDNQTPNL